MYIFIKLLGLFSKSLREERNNNYYFKVWNEGPPIINAQKIVITFLANIFMVELARTIILYFSDKIKLWKGWWHNSIP